MATRKAHGWPQALQQTSGVQRKQYEAWRKSLLRCLAHVEAVIDFGDDNDIQTGVAAEILPVATALRKELEGHLRDGKALLEPPPPFSLLPLSKSPPPPSFSPFVKSSLQLSPTLIELSPIASMNDVFRHGL